MFLFLFYLFLFITTINGITWEDWTNSAFGNEDNSTYSADLGTIDIIAKHDVGFEAPDMNSEVSAEEPFINTSSSYAEWLRYDTSVNFEGSPRKNGIDPAIRGFNGENVIKAIDGVRSNFFSKHEGSLFIDPSLISQINVIKGSASHLYGSGGLGGAILLNTINIADVKGHRPQASSNNFKLINGYKSANNEYLLNGAYVNSYGNLDVLTAATMRLSGDIHLSNHTLLSSKDRIESGLIKMNYNCNDINTIKFEYMGYNNHATEPNNPQIDNISAELSNTASTKKFAQKVKRHVINNLYILRYEYDNSDCFVTNIDTSIYNNDISIKDIEKTSFGIDALGTGKTRKMHSYGGNFYASINSNFALLEQEFLLGLEIYREKQIGRKNGGFYSLVPSGNSDNYAFILNDQITYNIDNCLGRKLVVTPEVRFDIVRNEGLGLTFSDSNISPRIVFAYYLEQNIFAFASYARNFRAPSINELYTGGEHFKVNGFINNFIPNPNLKSETSDNFEIGFGGLLENRICPNDSIELKSSYFRTFAYNLIDQRVVGYTIGTPICPFPSRRFGSNCSLGNTKFVNVRKALIDGVDMNFKYQQQYVEFDANYTFLNGTDKDNGYSMMRFVPHSFSTVAALKLPLYNMTIGVGSRYISRHELNDGFKKRGYGVHDLFFKSIPCSAIEVRLGVDNIFNKPYECIYANVFERARDFKAEIIVRW